MSVPANSTIWEPDSLKQLTPEELMRIIMQQQMLIQELQQELEQLKPGFLTSLCESNDFLDF